VVVEEGELVEQAEPVELVGIVVPTALVVAADEEPQSDWGFGLPSKEEEPPAMEVKEAPLEPQALAVPTVPPPADPAAQAPALADHQRRRLAGDLAGVRPPIANGALQLTTRLLTKRCHG
jgi:hypothetical protein